MSDIGNKNENRIILMSDIFYLNYIKKQKEKLPNKDVESWWIKASDDSYGTYYHGHPIISGFDEWVANGMKDE
ncbi:hypothetical protein ACQCV6_25335 [Bacillus cereus]